MPEHPMDLEPTVDDLMGFEPTGLPGVPVALEGPARTQALGAEDGSIRAVVADDVTGVKLINHDDRRSNLTIIPVDQPIYLAMTLNEVQAGNAAKIPIGTVVPLHGIRRLFARSATPGSSASVTVIAEQWAM